MPVLYCTAIRGNVFASKGRCTAWGTRGWCVTISGLEGVGLGVSGRMRVKGVMVAGRGREKVGWIARVGL